MPRPVQIDDELFQAMEQLAREKGTTVDAVVSQALRAALRQPATDYSPNEKLFVQPVRRLGLPKIDLTKALLLAGLLEDEQNIRRMMQSYLQCQGMTATEAQAEIALPPDLDEGTARALGITVNGDS